MSWDRWAEDVSEEGKGMDKDLFPGGGLQFWSHHKQHK